jgi:hypothetical protein
MDRSEAGKRGYEKSADAIRDYLDSRSEKCRQDYEENPKHCLFCGTKIPFEKRRSKFCDHSCSAKFNNKGVTRHIKRSKVCSCGNAKKLSNQYCDECIEKHVYNRTLRLEDLRTDRHRKAWLLERHQHRCQVCGLTDWMGKPIPIELDHIDGNADNNAEENLRLICPNCHAQTETYKAANKGKNSGRQVMRRKRYKEGLTY